MDSKYNFRNPYARIKFDSAINSINNPKLSYRCIWLMILRRTLSKGSLIVRTSDSRPDARWVRCSMPPNTLRVRTEYVLVKSVGPKVFWAESRVQGTGEYFPPLQSHGKIVEVEIDGIYIVCSGNFVELIRTVTCMVLKT
ncbi:uncharacterized protein TNCV_2233241 [Trichonephila clavipes]|nr:uncharacterized protein TNCV_2233241 [Trichonephila clavipes]